MYGKSVDLRFSCYRQAFVGGLVVGERSPTYRHLGCRPVHCHTGEVAANILSNCLGNPSERCGIHLGGFWCYSGCIPGVAGVKLDLPQVGPDYTQSSCPLRHARSHRRVFRALSYPMLCLTRHASSRVRNSVASFSAG
jgi:hypothetical protein